ncbi:MAG: hypothetical protein AAF721_26950 [Myxococcota bacterium]
MRRRDVLRAPIAALPLIAACGNPEPKPPDAFRSAPPTPLAAILLR